MVFLHFSESPKEEVSQKIIEGVWQTPRDIFPFSPTLQPFLDKKKCLGKSDCIGLKINFYNLKIIFFKFILILKYSMLFTC